MANESVTVTQSLDQVTVVSDGPIGLNAGGTILGALNVGVDGTGHDVKFFGDTAGKYMQWDQSADKLFVNGEIEVNGTATTFNSTVITIDDPIFTLGGQQRTDALDDSKDRGIEFFYHDGAQKTGFMGYDDSADAFTFLTSATNSNEVFSGTEATIHAGTVKTPTIGTQSGNLAINPAGGEVTIDGDLSIDGTHRIKLGTGISGLQRRSDANLELVVSDNTGQINLVTLGSAGGKAVNFKTHTSSAASATTVASVDESGNLSVAGNISGTASQNDQGIEFSASALTLRNGAGSGGETITLGSNGAVVNATSSSSFDFTVKSSTSASALHVESSDGNVGIGTASPAHLLHVYSSGNGEIEVERASGATILTQAQASLGRFGTSSNHNLQLMANNSGYVTVTTAGNVGIGTSAPTRELHLDSGDALTTFKISNSTSGATITDGFDIELSSTTARLNNREGNIELAVSNSNVATLSSDGLSLGDNLFFRCGDSADLTLSHDASNSYIANETGDLYIRNSANDKDIIFQSDDGSGGIETYFFLDGSANGGANPYTIFPDNSILAIGDSKDLLIWHNATNSYVQNSVGDLHIENYADDKDILFRSDNGSGGLETYFFLDGSTGYTQFPDNKRLTLGSSDDFQIFHDALDSTIQNSTGHLYVTNFADDKDIIFQSDDGSGGVTPYFTLDGSVGYSVAPKHVRFEDDIEAIFGADSDAKIRHSGSSLQMECNTGNWSLRQNATNADIRFYSDDGTGSATTEYFRVDGGTEEVIFSKKTEHLDNVLGGFGSESDLTLSHDGSNSHIANATGDLKITQNANDKDIVFSSDNGSGGNTPYLTLDGSTEQVVFSKALNYSTTLVNDSNYTTTRSDSVILFHSMSTYRYLTLASADCVAGRMIHVKNRDNAEYIYLQTEGSETIDGSTSIIGSSTSRGAITVVSDGSNWSVISKYST